MTEPLVITRITHSCHLIQIGDLTVLTDPWFSHRTFYHPGEPIALQPEALPHLDAVVISHEHYDHCDLQAFADYRDPSVPLFVAETVVPLARKHGFTNVTALAPWQQAELGGVTITATPAKHGVYEVTFVLRAGSDAVYFAGDTMLIPELAEIPKRLGHISLALLPTNGLHIRPANNMQVVMNADEAAELTAVLKPELAVPHHYAFTKGFLGDRLITDSDKNPLRFQDASRDLAPEPSVRIVNPGTRIEL